MLKTNNGFAIFVNSLLLPICRQPGSSLRNVEEDDDDKVDRENGMISIVSISLISTFSYYVVVVFWQMRILQCLLLFSVGASQGTSYSQYSKCDVFIGDLVYSFQDIDMYYSFVFVNNGCIHQVNIILIFEEATVEHVHVHVAS